ncbi:hypothetical protein JCM3775_004360 [Rhodotorula graminis]
MYGGSASSGGRWSLGAKTYRAPTEGERLREAQDRLVREGERRKIHEIKHEERHIRKQRELQLEAARANRHAVGIEHGVQGGQLLAGGLVAPSPRLRASSFGSYGARPVGLLGSPATAGGLLGSPGGGALLRSRSRSRDRALVGAERLALDEARRRETELARIRAQRSQLEAEAMRRQRTASSMRHERAALAAANQAILASPRMSPALLPYGGVGAGGQMLRRTHSWSGGVPGAGYGSPYLGVSGGLGGHHHHHHASPRVVPVPYPVPVQQPHLHGLHGGGVPLRARTPSPARLGMSPRLLARTPSPNVVNYNTFNVSPRVGGYGGGYGGGVGDLGALDDLNLHERGMIDPPLFGGGLLDDVGGPGGMGGMPGAFGAGELDFAVTDEAHVPGRTIVQDLGFVEGLSSRSGGGGLLSEDDRLNFAIADLTAQAQGRGANGVLQVETGEDLGGEIVVRGRAVVLA